MLCTSAGGGGGDVLRYGELYASYDELFRAGARARARAGARARARVRVRVGGWG